MLAGYGQFDWVSIWGRCCCNSLTGTNADTKCLGNVAGLMEVAEDQSVADQVDSRWSAHIVRMIVSSVNSLLEGFSAPLVTGGVVVAFGLSALRVAC